MRITLPNHFSQKFDDAYDYFEASVAALVAVIAVIVVLILLVYPPSAMASETLVKSDDVPAKLPDSATKSRLEKKPIKYDEGSPKAAFARKVSLKELQYPSVPERFVWNRVPIPITLGVGADMERWVTFPSQMFIGIPSELEQLIRVQTVDNTSYFTALAPFPKTRVVAEDRINGTVILLDVNAEEGQAPAAPVEISLMQKQPPVDRFLSGSEEDVEQPPDDVSLVRYAAKQLYAPRRLVAQMAGVRRVYLDSAPINDLYRGGRVTAIPIASWRGVDRWVTAVKLQNVSDGPVDLDPLALRGNWRAATFQHGRLLANGNDADTTAVYLISDRAFSESR